MREPLPTVLIPGLLCTPRLYPEQIPALWRFGPVTVADHTRDDSMGGIARRILSLAPPKFALVGLSMGGYVAFEMLRQAPDRVAKLALLDTTARPDAARADRAAQAANRDGADAAASTASRSCCSRGSWPPPVTAIARCKTLVRTHGRGHGRRSVRPATNGDHESRRLAAGPRRRSRARRSSSSASETC